MPLPPTVTATVDNPALKAVTVPDANPAAIDVSAAMSVNGPASVDIDGPSAVGVDITTGVGRDEDLCSLLPYDMTGFESMISTVLFFITKVSMLTNRYPLQAWEGHGLGIQMYDKPVFWIQKFFFPFSDL